MAFALTEEQVMLRESAAQFFRDKAPVSALRALRDGAGAGLDPDLWRGIANLGYAGVLIDEEHGGTGFGPTGFGLIMEEAGRTLAATPLLSTALLGSGLVLAAGSPAQKRKYLPRIADGSLIMALAMEEGPHHDPAPARTRAAAADGGFAISGRKHFVLDGPAAGTFIVTALTDAGPALFLVEAGADGVDVTQTFMVDSRSAAQVSLDRAAAVPLGAQGQGLALLEPVLDMARIVLAAEMLGGLREMMDRTVAYLKERRQFDAPIGSFQALQHRAALMLCEVELCTAVVRDALAALQDNRNDVPQMASLAKARLGAAARLITNEALQMHGGMGMTDEADAGLFLKRARVQAATFGDAAFHEDRYATLMGY